MRNSTRSILPTDHLLTSLMHAAQRLAEWFKSCLAHWCPVCEQGYSAEEPVHPGLACQACRAQCTQVTPRVITQRVITQPHTMSLMVYAVGSYTGMLARLVQAKIDRRYVHTVALAHVMAFYAAQRVPCSADYDVVIPIPTVPARSRARGYDHTQILAQAVAHSLNKPLMPALRITHEIPAQHTLDRAARLRNITHAIALSVEPSILAGKRILLIDDVCTTGSTLLAAGSLLQRAGGQVTAYVGALPNP